jgi:hypothetical protein
MRRASEDGTLAMDMVQICGFSAAKTPAARRGANLVPTDTRRSFFPNEMHCPAY